MIIFIKSHDRFVLFSFGCENEYDTVFFYKLFSIYFQVSLGESKIFFQLEQMKIMVNLLRKWLLIFCLFVGKKFTKIGGFYEVEVCRAFIWGR